jgi:sugar (pentulose or hexulose) kinase
MRRVLAGLVEAWRLWQQGDVAPERVAGLALTTQRGTVVCARDDGTPLRPAIVWPDQRLATTPPPLGLLWTTLFGLAGAGELIRQLQRQAECNWLAQHEPDLWSKCERYSLLSGWLTYRLVGEWVDSAACQVGYLPFDYKRQQWAKASEWHWKALAIRSIQLPRLVPPGAKLGGLTAEPPRHSACPRACR